MNQQRALIESLIGGEIPAQLEATLQTYEELMGRLNRSDTPSWNPDVVAMLLAIHQNKPKVGRPRKEEVS